MYNRGSVVEASQFIAKTLREVIDATFIGQKTSPGVADSIKNVLKQSLRALLEDAIITSSIDAPLGYKEETFSVKLTGNLVRIALEVKPVQGVDFVEINLVLGDITQTA